MPTVYLNTVQAGKRLRLSSRRVAKLCETHGLGQKIGRNWAITECQCDRFAQIPRLVGRKKRKSRSRLPSNL